MMAHNAGFTAVAVLTLAIGIGASTAIFSAMKPILIDPLPYPQASRLMMLWEARKDGAPMPVTFGTFHGLSERNRSFEALAVFKPWQPAASSTSDGDRPERIQGQRVSADYFRVLDVSPQLGRNFQASDDRFSWPECGHSRAIGSGADALARTLRSSASKYASTTRSILSSASCLRRLRMF